MPDPERPETVVQLISSYRPYLGGAEIATEGLVIGLEDLGWKVEVWTRAYSNADERVSQDGRVLRLGLPSKGKMGAATYVASVLRRLWSSRNGIGLVHAQGQHAQLVAGALGRLLTGCPFVQTIHTDLRISHARPGAWGRIKLMAVRRLASQVIALTEQMESDLWDLGVPPERVSVVPNAVDMNRFMPASDEEAQSVRAGLNIPANAIVFLFVGRLVSLKRVDLLLEAWKTMHVRESVHLIVVGEGPEATALKRFAGAQGLERVRFAGHADDVRPYLVAADVFVLPSDQEGQSIALLEAMAMGLIPVVSDLPGNRALVSDGETGILLRSRDKSDLADAMLIAADHVASGRYGTAAAASVRGSFGIKRSALAHARLYRRVLAESAVVKGA